MLVAVVDHIPEQAQLRQAEAAKDNLAEDQLQMLLFTEVAAAVLGIMVMQVQVPDSKVLL
jgi:hypothetical protein